MQKGAQAYAQTKVITTSPGEVLLMLYDGAINFMVQAKVKIQAKDYAGKGILISKVLDIVNELDSSLNRDKGGELSDSLHNLYFWCNTRLAMANLKMDTKYIDEVIKVMSGLRSAYAQIMETPEGQGASSEIAANQGVSAIAPMRKPVDLLASAPAGNLTAANGAKRSSAYGAQQNNFGLPPTVRPAPIVQTAAAVVMAEPKSSTTVAADEKPDAVNVLDIGALLNDVAQDQAEADNVNSAEAFGQRPASVPPTFSGGFGRAGGALGRYASFGK